MWIIIVIVIGSLAVLGLLILSIPFDLVVDLNTNNQPKLAVNWEWLFGLVKREIKFGRPASKRKKSREKLQEKPRDRFGLIKMMRRTQSILKIIKTRGFFDQIFKFLRRIIHQIKIRRLESEWYIGPDSPDEAFYLFALTEPLNMVIHNWVSHPVNIQPSFVEPGINGYLRIDLRIYPILLFPPLILFVFSIPTLKVIRQVIAARWRRHM